MSGQTELKVEERLKEAEKILEEYSGSIGLKAIKFNQDVERLLSMSQTDLKLLTEEELGIASFALNQYALFLQKEVNRHNAKSKWASHNLDIVIGKVHDNYGDKYTKFEVRKMLIINDNEFAQSLNKIILEAQLRIEELAFMSTRINTLGGILIELQKSKRASKYER